jgi:hypothetical protein
MDLTTPEGVRALMIGSKSETEWCVNAEKVKRANSRPDGTPDYPEFWHSEIILSGVFSSTMRSW